jgi:hypothetical protein
MNDISGRIGAIVRAMLIDEWRVYHRTCRVIHSPRVQLMNKILKPIQQDL